MTRKSRGQFRMKKTVKTKLVAKIIGVIACAVVLCTSLVGCDVEDMLTSSTERTEDGTLTIGDILEDSKEEPSFTIGAEYKVLDVHYAGADHIYLILALESVKDHTRAAYMREIGHDKNDYLYESIVKGDTIKFSDRSVEIVEDTAEDKEREHKSEKVEQ